jgi:hypothetical protein
VHPTDTFTSLVREHAAKVDSAKVVPHRVAKNASKTATVIDLTNTTARICEKRARPNRANFSHSKSETTFRVYALDSTVFLVFRPGWGISIQPGSPHRRKVRASPPRGVFDPRVLYFAVFWKVTATA